MSAPNLPCRQGHTLLLLLVTALLVSACNIAVRPATESMATMGTADLPQPTPAATPSPPASSQPSAVNRTAPSAARYTYRVVERYPHDPGAFTQGLIFADDVFYEGTGLHGRSTLRKVDPSSGEILAGVRLPDEVFGEGITLFGGKIFQLTWKDQIGYVLDRETFELLDTFHYPTEGWGLTHDGEQLIMSDGTHRLYYVDPDTLTQTGHLEVFDDDVPVERLNELEFIDGEIYANIWQTDYIVRISPENGRVTGWIDLSGLLSPADLADPVDVLNGIAYDAERDRLFVTGKLWPTVFEIELVDVTE